MLLTEDSVVESMNAALYFTASRDNEDSTEDISTDDEFSPQLLEIVKTIAIEAIKFYDRGVERGEYIGIYNSYSDDVFGHDIVFTAQRHGAGFWDGDWHTDEPGHTADKFVSDMCEFSHNYEYTLNIYKGDDGLLYSERY